MMNAFSQGLGGAGSGNFGQDVLDAVIDAANRNADGQYTGELDRAISDMQSAIQGLISQLMQSQIQSSDESGETDASGEGADSWLIAIAKALGEVAGDKAAELVEKSFELQQINDEGQSIAAPGEGASESEVAAYQGEMQQNAQQFAQTNAEYQAVAQEFSIIQNTISTTLKAIGEGISQVARKQ